MPSHRAEGRYPAPVAALALLLLAASSHADDPKHAVLWYLNAEPITADRAGLVAAYHDADGTAVDWMFDTMIVFDFRLSHHTEGSVIYPGTADVERYRTDLFAGGGLSALAAAVSDLRVRLGDPSYRLKVYLAAPALVAEDACANSLALIDAYEGLDPPELELVGFYWGYAEGLEGTDPAVSVSRIRATADCVHGRGYELIWIPLNHPTWTDGWLDSCESLGCGFDRITLQVGYAFVPSEPERFERADNLVHAHGIDGIEMEFHESGDLANARTYLSEADRLNWALSGLTTYYYASVIANFSSDPVMREIYDGLYRFISTEPRTSVLPRARIIAAEDTFVEEAAGYRDENHGDALFLNMGTNAYPNALRTYLLFDLSAAPPSGDILSAHLLLTRAYFPYGSSIGDGLVYNLSDTTWDEMTLTAETEPSASALSLIAGHKYVEPCAAHAVDVSGALRSLLASGSGAAFMLRRESEDGAAAEIQLHSKEAGEATAPVIVIVHRAADAWQDADDGPEAMEDGADAPDGELPPDVPVDGEGMVDATGEEDGTGDLAGDTLPDGFPDSDGSGGSGGCGCAIFR
jgi:hypothetical protein